MLPLGYAARRQLTVMVTLISLLPPLASQTLHGHDRQQAPRFLPVSF